MKRGKFDINYILPEIKICVRACVLVHRATNREATVSHIRYTGRALLDIGTCVNDQIYRLIHWHATRTRSAALALEAL